MVGRAGIVRLLHIDDRHVLNGIFLQLPTPYHSFPAFLTGSGTFQSGIEHILRFR